MEIEKKESNIKVFLSGMLWAFVAIVLPILMYIYRTGGLY